MNSKVYKWCAVPMCNNTSKATPNKLFVYVPNKKIVRHEWLKRARRNPTEVVTNSSIYFCEDHFDLPTDMENYMQYHLMGSVAQIRMKPGCVPKKFECQKVNKTDTLKTIEKPFNCEKKKMNPKECNIKGIDLGQIDYEEVLSGTAVPCKNNSKMTSPSMDDPQRLYLEKSLNGSISVSCRSLVQHQIDGIRFLFEQYRKKKLGVLLNYGARCGKSVLVALFINAVIGELDRPVLILYEQDREKRRWLKLFAKWTSIGEDEIAVEPTNIYIKKTIILKNTADMVTCCNRLWSILVVKMENMNKIFSKWQLKVNFKIWITSVDVKKDLDMLRSIYMWMNDSDSRLKELFDKRLALFRNRVETSEEPLTKHILLHSFLEDFLLRRSDLKSFSHMGISKKNKDATGKKIKRSQKHQDVQPISLQPSNEPAIVVLSGNINDNLNSKYSKRPRKDLENENEESKMDVESFIRDNEPLETDSNLTMAVKNLDDKAFSHNVRSVQAEEMSTDSFDFGSAVEDIVNVENNISTEKGKKSCNFVFQDLDNTKHLEELVFNPMDAYTPKIQTVFSMCTDGNSRIQLDKDYSNANNSKDNDEDTKEADGENSGDKGFILDINKIIKDEGVQDGDESTYSADEDIKCGDENINVTDDEVQHGGCFRSGDESFHGKNEAVRNGDDSTHSGDERSQGDESTCIEDEKIQAENATSFKDNEIQDGDVSGTHNEGDIVGEDESISIKDEIIHSKDIISNVDKNQESKLEVTSVMKTDSIFDSKMREMEERALKKFKGSFLDNIF